MLRGVDRESYHHDLSSEAEPEDNAELLSGAGAGDDGKKKKKKEKKKEKKKRDGYFSEDVDDEDDDPSAVRFAYIRRLCLLCDGRVGTSGARVAGGLRFEERAADGACLFCVVCLHCAMRTFLLSPQSYFMDED